MDLVKRDVRRGSEEVQSSKSAVLVLRRESEEHASRGLAAAREAAARADDLQRQLQQAHGAASCASAITFILTCVSAAMYTTDPHTAAGPPSGPATSDSVWRELAHRAR